MSGYNNSTGCGKSKGGAPPPPAKDLGPIIRAPLDRKSYKAIQLSNGLKVLLVSTCQHKLDLKECSESEMAKCRFEKVKEFNRVYLGIDKDAIGSRPSEEYDTSQPGCCGRRDDEDEDDYNNTCSKSSSSHCNDPNCKSNNPEAPPQTKDPAQTLCCPGGNAGFSLVVGAGSFHDPYDVPGIAHLCEHSIFLGSKKYPAGAQLFDFANQCDGKVNAVTSMEVTSFFAICKSDRFEEFLEAYSDALTNPILDPETIQKERNALDSEFAINSTCDATRMYDFLSWLAKDCHPLKKFYWGNRETLNVKDIGQRVKEFYQRYYASNYMTLCLQSHISMSELERLAVKYFSDLRPSTEPHPRDELGKFGPPYDKDSFGKFYHLVPISKVRWMLWAWCLPADMWKDFHTKPLRYIKVVLNTEAPGGIYHYLRKKHWVTAYHSTCNTTDTLFRNTFCSVFKFNLELTEEGFQNRDQIIHALYSYIKMIKNAGTQWRTFAELKRTQANMFHYTTWDDLFETTLEFAATLQSVPPKYILTSKCLMTKFKKDTIDDILNRLDPRKAILIVVAPEFAKEPGLKSALNGRFRYTEGLISKEMYDALENIPIYKEFHLPPNNSFLSKEVGVPNDEKYLRLPQGEDSSVLYSSDKMKMVLKDTEPSKCYPLRLHQVRWDFRFYSSKCQYQFRPYFDLWTHLLTLHISKEINNSYDSLVSWEWERLDETLCLTVHGPSFHLTQIVTTILDLFDKSREEIEADPQYFYDVHDSMLASYENELADITRLAEDTQDFLLVSGYKTIFQRIQFMKEFEDKATSYRFFLTWMKRYKEEMFINVEVAGNVTQSSVDEITRKIHSFDYDPFLNLNYYKKFANTSHRAVLFPVGGKIIRMKAKHPAYQCSVILNLYQFPGIQNEDEIGTYDFILKLIYRVPFLQLRYAQSLGYKAQCEGWEVKGCKGMFIKVISQAEKFNTDYIDERIDACLVDFYKKHLKSAKAFNDLKSKYSKRFSKNSYAQTKEMYEKYLLVDGSEFRKVSIQVVGYTRKESKPGDVPKEERKSKEMTGVKYDIPCKGNKEDFIQDIFEFRASCELQPILDGGSGDED